MSPLLAAWLAPLRWYETLLVALIVTMMAAIVGVVVYVLPDRPENPVI